MPSFEQLKESLLETTEEVTKATDSTVDASLTKAQDIMTQIQESTEALSGLQKEIQSLGSALDRFKTKAKVQVLKDTIHRLTQEGLEGLKTVLPLDSQEFFVPEAAPEETKSENGFDWKSMLMSVATPFTGIYSSTLAFFNLKKKKAESSVDGSFGLHMKKWLVALTPGIPFVQDAVDAWKKEQMTEIDRRIEHRKAVRIVEKIVASFNKNRESTQKISIDLADFDDYDAVVSEEALKSVREYTMAAINERSKDDHDPLRWKEIVKAKKYTQMQPKKEENQKESKEAPETPTT